MAGCGGMRWDVVGHYDSHKKEGYCLTPTGLMLYFESQEDYPHISTWSAKEKPDT